MAVPLLDLQAQYASVRDDVEAAVREVMESQRFILGPAVEELEQTLARYSGCAYGVGVSSGTDALLIALMAAGIGPGDEVIVPDLSFFATAGVVSRLSATPVFADVEPIGLTLDVERIEPLITPRTRAIVVVHLYGQMAEMPPILELASRHELTVIEDAAQSIGAERESARAGSLGDFGCLSFFPSKNLGGGGDGGMVVCQDPDRAERLRLLRSHGAKPKYYHHLIGGNFRLDALQAAIVQAKFPYLDRWTEARQRNAARYRAMFEPSGRVVPSPGSDAMPPGAIALPQELPARRHVYNQFVVRVARRDELRSHLTQAGIGSEVYYPVPFHAQPCFSAVHQSADAFPTSVRAASEVLALPIYPELSEDQQREVVSAVLDFLER